MPPRNPSVLTTGQAAKLCEVTPDTILKWIRKGRLQGARTAGGHYRINLQDLRPHIAPGRLSQESEQSPTFLPQRLRCWEYLSANGDVRESCKECVVYRVGAAGCFLMASLEPEIGHSKRFCQTSCDECVYYRRVKGLATNVLVLTRDEEMASELREEEDKHAALRVASNGYDASAIIEEFRPAFAVVDEQLLLTTEPNLLHSLGSDPRIPGLRVILASSSGRSPRGDWANHDLIVQVLEKPLRLSQITDVISSFPVDTVPPDS